MQTHQAAKRNADSKRFLLEGVVRFLLFHTAWGSGPRAKWPVSEEKVMHLRTVLCPVDLTPLSNRAVDLGVALCRRFGSEPSGSSDP